jgi:hypothetical protein
MDKILARKLNKLLSEPEVSDIFVEYIDFRLAGLHKYLESSSDLVEISRLQGRILELKEFMGLRESTLNTLNKGT